MKNSRRAVFLTAGFFLLLIISAGCISLSPKNPSEPADSYSALLNGSATTASTVSENTSATQKESPSPELLKELRKFGVNYYKFGIHRWEFGPKPDEITLYAYSIRNQSQIDALRGMQISNYTIRIIHDTEFERTQHELVQKLTLLQQDSRYQIDHFYTVVDPFGDPPGYYIELWTLGYTPENRKLDNTMMQGWKIQVYPISPDPTNPPLPTRVHEKNSSETADSQSAVQNVSATRNPALISTSSGLKQFPPEIQGEIRTLSDNYSIAPDYWGFDSLNNEIDLIAYGIHDLNATKDLQKKKIGNYSIHIFNDTEWQSTAKEVADNIWELEKNPDNKIGGSELVNDPKGPYAILWCYSSTPANKKLDNTMIKGWKIFVYIQSFPPPMQTTMTMSSYVTS